MNKPFHSVEEIKTGDNRFIYMLQQRFGDTLGFEDPEDTKSFIAKTKSFYSSVKDAHRDQRRKGNGDPYFQGHVHPVVDITLSFSESTIRDAVVALGHDFVEDHRELSYEEALSHIRTTFGKWGKKIAHDVDILTKKDLETYCDDEEKERLRTCSSLERGIHMNHHRKRLSKQRAIGYFSRMEQEGSNVVLRVKTGDAIHNLLSCKELGYEGIMKTLSEKEEFLLPLLRARGRHEEKRALIQSIGYVKSLLRKE